MEPILDDMPNHFNAVLEKKAIPISRRSGH